MITLHLLDVAPMAAPRQTRSDAWDPSPAVQRYRAYQDELRYRGVRLAAEDYYHLVFLIRTPPSWTKARRRDALLSPHQQKPDKDNLEKALLDALFSDDAHAWDGRASKVWWKRNGILVLDGHDAHKLDVMSAQAIADVLELCRDPA